MAEELQFPSRTETKRKYEDQTPPPISAGPRRPTGFSDGPDVPSLNNSDPVGIEIAKAKAQAIASRLSSQAEAKRPKFENVDDSNGSYNNNSSNNNSRGFTSGFSSGPTDPGQYGQGAMAPVSSIPVSYGGYQSGGYHSGSSKKIDIPNGRVGVIIGKSGDTIKYLQQQSGAKIQVTRDMDVDPNSPTRPVELTGTPEQIEKAEKLIKDVLAEAETGGSGVVSRRFQIPGQNGAGDQFQMQVPSVKVGLIIGKGGETIKNMQNRSGARIQLHPLHPPPGEILLERTVFINGSPDQIESAKQMINEVINSENRPRNSGMGGGYNQQGYRPQQTQQSNWGQPAVQQPGYGYVQPGGQYAGAPPQYNMPQQSYTGYPPQTTTPGWDQTTASQQTPQGGGYDYYNQQPPQQQQTPGGSSTPTDNTGYNYGQPPASNYSQQPYGGSAYSQPPAGQPAYSQDAYGGYNAAASQSGYAQPQQGYDQSQGYNSATPYGSGVSSAPDVAAPAYGAQGGVAQVPPVQPAVTNPQGYAVPQASTTTSYPAQGPQPTYPATSQPGYGAQPPTQTGYGQSAPLNPSTYGPPQGQKPPSGQPAYGQTQPSSTQAGYIQPASAQPGYTHAQTTPPQTGSGQPDSSHRPQAAGFGTSAPQSGYVQPPYGVLPATQPAYGAQQQQPYADSYGGGYGQPPVYSTDGTVNGNAHGSYDAGAPASQSVQQSAVPKASPQA